MVETIESLDFELEIAQGRDLKYPVTVLESPAGRAEGTLHVPFSPRRLERYLQELRFALLHPADSRPEEFSEQERVAQEFGRRLFDALFADEVGILYDSSRHQAAAQGKVLRLKLRIQPPELALLPWELLYDSHLGEYLCLSHATPLARYVEHPEPTQPAAVTPPLRILGIVAPLPGGARADLERGKRPLEEATQHLQSLELVTIEWLEGGTWSDLQQAFGSQDWHVIHYVGEGGLDDRGEAFVALADGDGDGQGGRLTATRLSQLLASGTSPLLVWLSASQGAQGGVRDRFSGMATHLVQQGIPAVLTVQYRLNERVTEAFGEAFYAALAASMPVDLAVAKGRMAVRSQASSTLEWSLPVLHTHSPGLCPFDRKILASTARRRGDEAMAGDQFERAILQYTLAAEVGADPDAREGMDLAAEAHQAVKSARDLFSARDLLGSPTDDAEARADAVLQVVEKLKGLEQRLPDSQAIHQLLSQAGEETSALRDQLWQDSQQLMRRRAVGLTLAGQRRRMEESVRLLQKAALLDKEEGTALKEDLAKATHRLGYLQNAQAQAQADRGRRLRIYGIVAAVVIGLLLLGYVLLNLVPTPTPVAGATPVRTATPTRTTIDTATAAPSPTANPTRTASSTDMATSVGGANPTPGVTASPSPAPSHTPTLTSSPTREPTASPTSTATSTQVTAGPPPATPSLTPTLAPTATPTAGIVYPAPVLIQPEDVVFLSQGADTKYTMRWEWEGTLQADEWFDVRIWQAGTPHHGVAWTKEPYYVYDICLKRNGLYFWSVAIVRGEGGLWLADLSPEATPRYFSSSRSDEWCAVHGRWVQDIVE